MIFKGHRAAAELREGESLGGRGNQIHRGLRDHQAVVALRPRPFGTIPISESSMYIEKKDSSTRLIKHKADIM